MRCAGIAATAAVVAVAVAAAPTQARSHRVVPRTGDWEGVGAHRLPLSFELVRRHRRIAAGNITLGSPFWCPADERDAESVPLFATAYAGPGGPRASGGSSKASAVLSGRVPGGSTTASLTGDFTSAQSGTFTLQVDRSVGCGWPAGSLTWQVHAAQRPRVPDGTWTATVSGPDITRGTVRLRVVGQGRVVNSVSASCRCQTATSVGSTSFKTSPAYEFIRPGGDFYSPQTGNTVGGHITTWSGRFSGGGALTGTLNIYDACTERPAHVTFVGGLSAQHSGRVRKPGSPRLGRGSRRGRRR